MDTLTLKAGLQFMRMRCVSVALRQKFQANRVYICAGEWKLFSKWRLQHENKYWF